MRLPRWGRVLAWSSGPAWMVVDPDFAVVPPITEFLADLAARPTSAASVRSYAYDLLRW
ncbi:hypothetical protein QRX50_35980 [Amycolatopsis carbonis]|uniref:Integrase n=1 Tax=Amycolatopsis carbonis TaxID=715471 RepID=A0A9Y2MQ42_9PSEU|nr:hypothetical protein [Amycolatopsis sp. 2-15]WIX76795.1 hypothetical protein QRX50_35980 [Amycolatopsis sp. 2-15]